MNVIIIVAPPALVDDLRRATARHGDVLAFSSLGELDAWRREQQCAGGEPIGPDLIAALAEIECTDDSLPPLLSLLFETIASSITTPTVRELLERWPSRRSFYRTWSTVIPLPPSAFLRRVRTLHAARLLARGMPAKEAAYVAGFSSPDHMRRVRNRA